MKWLVALAIIVCLLIRPMTARAQGPDPDTFVACNAGAAMEFKISPGFCSTLRPTGTIANSIALHSLHWSHWGRSSATAVGRTRTKTYDPWIKVRIRAYQRVWSDCAGGYVYTRLRTTTKYGRHAWSMPQCVDEGVNS